MNDFNFDRLLTLLEFYSVKKYINTIRIKRILKYNYKHVNFNWNRYISLIVENQLTNDNIKILEKRGNFQIGR